MKPQYPNLSKVELIAQALGELHEQLVFVGGCAVDLLLSDAAAAPVFVATKLEAFADRGQADLLGSHDLEDIVNVLDGRPEIIEEIAASPAELQRYLAGRCEAMLATSKFMDAIHEMIFPDESHTERVRILTERLQQIAQSVPHES